MKVYNLEDAIKHGDKVKELFIHGRSIEQLPKVIQYLSGLRKLSLRNNSFTVIPDEISLLSHLEELDLSQNQIQKIPESLNSLVNLKVLRLSKNSITNIGQNLSRLDQLTHLFLDGNRVDQFSFAQLSSDKLIALNLANNKLSKCNFNGASVQNLKKLTLDNNKLKLINWQGIEFSKLELLSISKNRLSKIGEINAPHLRDLSLQQNRLESLESEVAFPFLRKLNLSKNKLNKVHPSWLKANALTKLNLSKNQFEELPTGISREVKTIRIGKNKLSKITEDGPPFRSLKLLGIENNTLSQLGDINKIFPKLESINLTGNPITELPKGLIEAENLKSVKGIHHVLKPNFTTRQFLRFCNLCRLQNLSMNEKEMLFQSMQQLSFSFQLNQKWVSLIIELRFNPLIALLKKVLLEKHGKGSYKKGSHLWLAGTIGVDTRILTAYLSSLSIHLCADADRADVLILPKGYSRILPFEYPTSKSIESEEALIVYVKKQRARFSLIDEKATVFLSKLIESGTVENISLAVEQLTGKQVPEQLWEALNAVTPSIRDSVLRKKVKSILLLTASD